MGFKFSQKIVTPMSLVPKLTAVVIAWTRSAQVRQSPSMERGGRREVPSLPMKLLAIASHRERRNQHFKVVAHSRLTTQPKVYSSINCN